MLIFDADPLAAVLVGEPAARHLEPLLVRSLAESAIAAINAAEVVDVVARSTGVTAGAVAAAVDLWIEGGLRVVDVDWRLALRAAELRRTEYHRTRAPVSLADCTAIALAERLGGSLVTSDRAMLHAARSIGVAVTSVPNSTGRIS